MADFSALIAQIEAYVKQNGNNEITGNGLQSILVGMVNALGTVAITALQGDLADEVTARTNADGAINAKIPAEASSSNKLADKAFVTGLTTPLRNAVNAINANIENGYVYAGIATPSGTPVSGKVFYLARQAGTYTNFGGLTLTEGVNVLKYNGTAWSQEQLISIADIYNNPLIGYYECDTAGATAAKTVAATGYVLPATGGSVKIKMANRNTVANATLNINSTGAKPLYYNGQRAGVGNTWDTNEIVEVFYDGTNYQAYNVAGSNGDGVFDISTYNLTNGQPTPYVDLEAALGTNGVNIPESIRKGGMQINFILQYFAVTASTSATQPSGTSIDYDLPGSGSHPAGDFPSAFRATLGALTAGSTAVFYHAVSEGGITTYYVWSINVQTSDNKYVQYRLITDSWSTNTENWVIADEGVLVENPEYIYTKTDANNKILWAIKVDGSIYYGAGVPQQVIDYIEEKIADLLLDEYEDIVAFLNDLEKGDKTLQTLLDEKVDKEEGKGLIPTQYIQEVENPEFVSVCSDNEDKLIEATTKKGRKVFFGDVDVKQDFTAKKISSKKIYLGEEELSPASTVNVNTIIRDPEERLEIKTDEEQKILSYRDEKGILHENVGIETKELKLSQDGLDFLSKDLKVNWSDYISNDGENPLHLSIPKCARINLLTDFDLTKLSKKGYSVNSKAGVNYDIPIEIEFWDMQGNYFKKKAFIGGQGDSTMAFDKKNIAIDLFDSEWDGDAFSIKFGDWVAQDSYHLKAYDYEPFVGVGTWSYKLFDQMATIYDQESDRIWKKALWDTTDNIPTQASGSDLEESSEYNDTGAKCFPDGFPVIIYQNDAFWGVFSMQLKKHRDNYHLSGSKPNHVFLDGKIGEGTLDANGSPNAIRWDLWEVRNPKNLVYAPFAEYDSETTYKEGDSVTDSSRSKIYRSLQDDNTGNPLTFPYWKDCGEYTYKYDADVTQAEIAGNHDGSSSYNNWTAGTYNVGDLRKHTIDGKSHIFMNVVAGNDKEPAIVYNARKDEWYNTDKSPDFKNKSKCGWLNITNTVKVKGNIFAFTTIMTKIDAKETAYLANPTAENLAAMKAEFETYFDVQNLIDYIIVTDVIRDDDAFWKNWLWTTYDGVKWWCNLYDCNISFGYGGAGTGGYYRSPAPYMWNGEQYHLCTYKSLQPDGHSDFMLRYIIDYYADELKQTWIELRESKIIDENNIYNIAKNWIDSVGLNAYSLENNKWEYVKHIDNMMRIYKWICQSVLGLDQLYGYFNNLYADFTIYRSTDRDYTIRCIDMKVSHVLSRQYFYIQGYVTRHESIVGGETVSTYSITGGAETDEDITKTYTTVKDAIIAASSQPVDVPSSTLSYIMARCENIEYHRK